MEAVRSFYTFCFGFCRAARFGKPSVIYRRGCGFWFWLGISLRTALERRNTGWC
jgi:hypothetical protein